MDLNIITAGANSVWQALLHKLSNPGDITMSLSRRWCGDIPYVQDIRVTDLANTQTTAQELNNLFLTLSKEPFSSIRLFHNCCYVIAEIPELDSQHPYANNPKLKKIDLDEDGLDDRTYHALLTTFRNVFNLVSTSFPNQNLSVWAICSLTDKKSYIPTVFDSMVRTNLLFRKELQNIVDQQWNVQVGVISASTIATDTEVHFRSHSEDKAYWLTGEQVAQSLIAVLEKVDSGFVDADLFIHHPDRETKFNHETDEQMTLRIKKEIWLS